MKTILITGVSRGLGRAMAEEWAKTAVPFLLKINVANNGKQMTVPI